MTVSSTFPAVSSDLLFASESPIASQQNHRFNGSEKLAALTKQARSLVPALTLGIALCGMACASIFIVIAEQELSPIAIAFNRLLIATIAFALWQTLPSRQTDRVAIPSAEATPLQGGKGGSIPEHLPLLVLAGLCFAASLSLSAWSLTQTSVANSALLNNMMPVFTTLGAWVFLGQRFSPKFLMGLAVAIVGVITIGIQDLHITGNQIMGDAAALVSAILLAVTILSVERLRTILSAASIMTAVSLIGSLTIFPVLCWSHDSLFPTSWTGGLAVLGLALVSQVIGHGLLTYSLKQFSSGLISVSMLSIPMLATVLAMVLFSQPLSLLNGVAFLVVMLGIYLAVSAPKFEPQM